MVKLKVKVGDKFQCVSSNGYVFVVGKIYEVIKSEGFLIFKDTDWLVTHDTLGCMIKVTLPKTEVEFLNAIQRNMKEG